MEPVSFSLRAPPAPSGDDEEADDRAEDGLEQWSREPPGGWAPSARESVGLVADGDSVYLIGGMGGGSSGGGGRSNEVGLFSRSHGCWQVVPHEGEVMPERSGHSCSIVGREVWIFGGEGAYAGLNKRAVFGDLHAFHLDTHVWRRLPMVGAPPFGMPPPGRRGHTATFLPGGHGALLVYGGAGPDRVFGMDVYFDDLQLLDVATMSWRQITFAKGSGGQSCPGARARHSAVLLPDLHAVFVYGGLSAQVVSTVKMPRLAFLKGDRLKAQQNAHRKQVRCTPHRHVVPVREEEAAASSRPPPSGFADSTLYRLDTVSLEWEVAHMQGESPGKLQGHTASFSPLTPHCFYIYGGRGEQRPVEDLFVADMATSLWSKVAAEGASPGPRYGHAAAVTDRGEILVFGGNRFYAYCNPDLFAFSVRPDQPPIWPPVHRGLLRKQEQQALFIRSSRNSSAASFRSAAAARRPMTASSRRRLPPAYVSDDPDDSMVLLKHLPVEGGRPSTPMSVFKRRPSSSPSRFTLHGREDALKVSRERVAKHRERSHSPPPRRRPQSAAASAASVTAPGGTPPAPRRRVGQAPVHSPLVSRRPATTREMVAMHGNQRISASRSPFSPAHSSFSPSHSIVSSGSPIAVRAGSRGQVLPRGRSSLRRR